MGKLKYDRIFNIAIIAIFILGIFLVGVIGYVSIRIIQNPEIIGEFLGKIINPI